MECIIRPAEPRDSPHIMRMIRELAEYEKITHFITLSEDVLHRDGFGETPWFRSVVAELPEAERSETGVPFAGYALFANSYSSWTGRTLHLEDLYVSPRFRGRGLGRRLMARVAQELADFEKLSDQVKITAEELRRDGFEEPSPLFRCLVVENSEEEEQDTSWCTAPPPSCISCVRGRRLMGYALFFFTYSTWEGRSLYLEDLYIRPQYRGKGIGSRLFTAVTELCLSLGCARLQLSVLDWNHSAISFYRSRGARDLTQEEGWRVFRFLPDDLRRIGSS
ncbi:thialysine N-epsilon-acetyltransferase-like isoform X7 [Engystomops pustulosus]|uniref:thialysine N-epsilon-acetyltransferase-like isoform X7 n=1 Tax=Engystomops pustulosus TaxID=76066 RepID=UPI003AFA2EFF